MQISAILNNESDDFSEMERFLNQQPKSYDGLEANQALGLREKKLITSVVTYISQEFHFKNSSNSISIVSDQVKQKIANKIKETNDFGLNFGSGVRGKENYSYFLSLFYPEEKNKKNKIDRKLFFSLKVLKEKKSVFRFILEVLKSLSFLKNKMKTFKGYNLNARFEFKYKHGSNAIFKKMRCSDVISFSLDLKYNPLAIFKHKKQDAISFDKIDFFAKATAKEKEKLKKIMNFLYLAQIENEYDPSEENVNSEKEEEKTNNLSEKLFKIYSEHKKNIDSLSEKTKYYHFGKSWSRKDIMRDFLGIDCLSTENYKEKIREMALRSNLTAFIIFFNLCEKEKDYNPVLDVIKQRHRIFHEKSIQTKKNFSRASFESDHNRLKNINFPIEKNDNIYANSFSAINKLFSEKEFPLEEKRQSDILVQFHKLEKKNREQPIQNFYSHTTTTLSTTDRPNEFNSPILEASDDNNSTPDSFSLKKRKIVNHPTDHEKLPSHEERSSIE